MISFNHDTISIADPRAAIQYILEGRLSEHDTVGDTSPEDAGQTILFFPSAPARVPLGTVRPRPSRADYPVPSTDRISMARSATSTAFSRAPGIAAVMNAASSAILAAVSGDWIPSTAAMAAGMVIFTIV